MKEIISEEALRIFVRSKIRGELNKKRLHEQGKISVSQTTAITGIDNMTFEKCEIKIPQEFKELYNQLVKGRSERAKIDLFTRAMKYGVNADELMVKAAADTGVSRWDLTSPEAGSEILDPTEIELWRKFVESFPGASFPIPGGIGIRWSDFPAADAAGEYVWNQLRRAAIAYDRNIAPMVPGVVDPIGRVDRGLESIPDRFNTTDIAKTKALQSADPSVLPDQTQAVTAEQLVEKWRKFTKARVYILNPKTKEYEVQYVSGKRLTWDQMDKKYSKFYGDIFKMIENVVTIINQLATYSGVPGVFCWMAEKVIGRLASFADYFYEPQTAREWKRIHDEAKQLRDNYEPKEEPKFSIKKEIESAISTISIADRKIAARFDGSFFEADNLQKKFICLYFPKFSDKYVKSSDVSGDLDDIMEELEKDCTARLSEIVALERLSTAGVPKVVYRSGMSNIQDIAFELYTSRKALIDATQNVDIKQGIMFDISQGLEAAIKALIDYIKKPGCDLYPKSADAENIVNDLYNEVSD